MKNYLLESKKTKAQQESTVPNGPYKSENSPKQVKADDVFWNMVGSMLNAAASVLLLFFVTRAIGVTEGGIFSLAYATAQILLTIGKFGVRSFQATDLKYEIRYGTYLKFRILCCGLMLLLDVVFCIFQQYPLEKTLIFFFVCMMKMVDALEDVTHGELQRRGHLGFAGRLLTIRNFLTIVLFGLCSLVSEDLFFYCSATALFSFGFTVLVNMWGALRMGIHISKEETLRDDTIKKDTLKKEPFKKDALKKGAFHKDTLKDAKRLLTQCTPLFLGSFFSLLIYNIPKYVIDYFGEEAQIACFTILFMPTFVINMCSDFVFKPMLTIMASDWQEKRMKEFMQRIYYLLAGIAGFTAVAFGLAYYLGIPVLSWFYQVDLTGMEWPLCVLVLGGGFSAMVYLFYQVLTCMRQQKMILFGYMLTFLFLLLLSLRLQLTYGILGQCFGYLVAEAVLAIAFFTWIAWKGKMNEADWNSNISGNQ